MIGGISVITGGRSSSVYCTFEAFVYAPIKPHRFKQAFYKTQEQMLDRINRACRPDDEADFVFVQGRMAQLDELERHECLPESINLNSINCNWFIAQFKIAL